MNRKILIMMLYYERPNLVRNALKSIIDADRQYHDWHLAFHDDASPTPGEPIVREVLGSKLTEEKVTFYRTYATKEQKLASGGMVGLVMNQMIKNSDADLALILCDDDALHPQCLKNLNDWFGSHPSEKACYSHVIVFDPNKGDYLDAKNYDNGLNFWKEPINPAYKLDASQVAWRTSVNKHLDVWFPYPCEKNHDTTFFNRLHDKIGVVSFSGFYGQYKAIHDEQLAQVGQSENAQEIIKTALKTAMGYFLAGQFAEGRRLYEQILKADPENVEAQQMLRECIAVVPQSLLDSHVP